MSIADMVSRRLSRLSRPVEIESGQKDPKNLLAVPSVPSVPTDIIESREALKTSVVDIQPAVAIPANRDANTAFPVGTVGTVGTANSINGKICPDLPKPESGQSGQIFAAEARCIFCGQKARHGRRLVWFRNWDVAHHDCNEQVEVDRLLAAGHRAVASPDALADPAELVLNGELE